MMVIPKGQENLPRMGRYKVVKEEGLPGKKERSMQSMPCVDLAGMSLDLQRTQGTCSLEQRICKESGKR